MGKWFVTLLEVLPEASPLPEPQPEPQPGPDGTLLLLAAAGVIIAVLLAAVIGLLLRQRKRQAPPLEEPSETAPASPPARQPACAPEPPAPVGAVAVGKLHEQGARAEQQDSFGVSDEALLPTHGLLAVVADGMGGLADGGKVSAQAVEAILDGFMSGQGRYPPEQQLLLLARQAVRAVDRLLGAEGQRKSGSTLAVGLVRDGAFSFLSIGDSRICLLRQGALVQLNREHIYKNQLALKAVNGEMPLQDAWEDPKGAGLVSFLGMGALTQLDWPADPIRLLPGDKIILMSDGVYNALSEAELTAALAGEPAQAAAAIREAIAAKAYTNQDNYTAVILGCGAGSAQPAAAAPAAAADSAPLPQTEDVAAQ